jgi:hypothetical protein
MREICDYNAEIFPKRIHHHTDGHSLSPYAASQHDGCVFNRVEPWHCAKGREKIINMFITFESPRSRKVFFSRSLHLLETN